MSKQDEKYIYDIKQGDYRITANYIEDLDHNAKVVIEHKGVELKSGIVPGYKVYNYAAHFNDFIEDHEQSLAVEASEQNK
jgi:hypothetical protein